MQVALHRILTSWGDAGLEKHIRAVQAVYWGRASTLHQAAITVRDVDSLAYVSVSYASFSACVETLPVSTCPLTSLEDAHRASVGSGAAPRILPMLRLCCPERRQW